MAEDWTPKRQKTVILVTLPQLSQTHTDTSSFFYHILTSSSSRKISFLKFHFSLPYSSILRSYYPPYDDPIVKLFKTSFYNILMLSKALQSILRRYFGEFITGLENVELTFWSGKINIQNASFKHDKINELLKLHNIPLSIKLSFLGNLEIDIPWNKLTSAPV